MRPNADQNEMIWRVGVTNVTNEKYWSGMTIPVLTCSKAIRVPSASQ